MPSAASTLAPRAPLRLAELAGRILMARGGNSKGKGNGKGSSKGNTGPHAKPMPNVSPPTAPQPERLRPAPRPLPKPQKVAPLDLDDAAASEDLFTTAASMEQQLRKRPAPVAVPEGNGLRGRPLSGYAQGSSSFPTAAERAAASADGRILPSPSSPSSSSSKAKSGSPKSSPKTGGESSPRAGKRRDFEPLDSHTARKIESLRSEKSSALEKSGSSSANSARARQHSSGTVTVPCRAC